ncbi:MAG: SCO family protein [Anaerolineales bacterium]
MSSKRSLLAFAAFALIGLTAVLLIAQFSRPYTLRGSQITPPLPAPEINLPDQHGSPFRIADQQGKIVLIFFGYTHCPDVCPVTLSEYKQLRQQFERDAQNIRFVFISVDPQRDTPELMARHLANVHPDILGITGSEEQLQPVWQAYGVTRTVNPVEGASGYLVDHTARTYLIDTHGNLRATYPFGMDIANLAADIRYLLTEK